MNILDPDHDIEEVKWVSTQTFQKLNPKLYHMLKLNQQTQAFMILREIEQLVKSKLI